MAASTPAHDPELTLMETLGAETRACEADNEQLRREILEMHRQLEEMDELPAETDDPLSRIAALEAELASVEAQLATLRSPRANPTPHRSEARVQAEARARVWETVAELEKALEWESDRRAEEESALARDKLLFSDATALQASLAARAERASSAGAALPPRAAGELLVLRTQGHVARLSDRFGALQRALVGFVDGVLAEPEADARVRRVLGSAEAALEGEEEEGGRGRKRRKTTASTGAAAAFDLCAWIRAGDDAAEGGGDESRAFQLKKLVETLMNLSITTPSSPYLSTHPAFAPELVAFLLRAGIAQEHPREPGRVRLVDFAGVVLSG